VGSRTTIVARDKRALRWVQLLFLAIYGAYGTTALFRVLYYRRVGLTSAQIGLLIAMEPMVMLVSGPLWSMVADRTGLRGRLLTLVTGMSIVPLMAMIWLQSWGALALLTALHAMFLGPIQPLSDSSALSALGSKREEYSRVRALGSLSYAIVVWGTGVLLQGRDLRWVFPGFALLMGTACLISTRVRTDQPSLAVSLGSGLGTLLRDRAWVTFMVALFLSMVMQTVTFGYSALYLDALGASEGVVGFSGALGSFGQTLLMLFVIPGMLRRWGSERLLLLALGVYAVRLGMWSLIPQVWAVVASMAVMGFTFGTALVAAVDFADRHAPPGLATTSQALATGLVSGMGRSAGGILAGSLYDGIGPQATFGVFTVISLAALAAFAVVWRRRVAPIPAGARE